MSGVNRCDSSGSNAFMPTIDAYLSVYNDFDLVETVLSRLKGMIRELVVVDGGYEWMLPYLIATGKDPQRSDDEFYRKLEASGLNWRAVNGVWANEIEKRKAGYEACTSDYVLRVDADEVSFFDADAIDEFINSGGAVAEMALPMYDSPGLVQSRGLDAPFPRQGFLFDRDQVGVAAHLNYLWLVLTADRLDHAAKLPIFARPVAFNAHLSQWRTPNGGVQRASFYVLNYLRTPGLPSFSGSNQQDFFEPSVFFKHISPEIFQSAMKRSKVINSQFEIDGGHLLATPLTEDQEGVFAHHYNSFLSECRIANQEAHAFDQGFISGQGLFFHLTAQGILCLDQGLEIQFSDALVGAEAKLHTVEHQSQPSGCIALQVTKESTRVKIRGQVSALISRPLLRTILEITAWSDRPCGTFRLITRISQDLS